jgi:hypothetical protein
MVAADVRTTPILLAVSSISVFWGLWEGQAYWSVLSLLAVTWAAWSQWRKIEINNISWVLVTASLVAVPALGSAAGPSLWTFLVDVFAPVLLYSLSLGTIAATLGASRSYGPGPMALITFLAAISAGCLVLLSLYYLDALLSTNYLTGNSDLMWPLSALLLGTFLITIAVHVLGLENIIWEPQEVSG